MAEILSQAEIDALISSISPADPGTGVPATPRAAERPQRRVRAYDFRRPDKFSKDQLRTLQMVHEGFARLLTTHFTATFRTVVQLVVGSVDQATYAEFIRAIHNPSVLCPFRPHPLHGTCVLDINPVLAFPMLDRMFGGPGSGLKEVRELTEIEKQVMLRVVRGTLGCLQEAWANLTAVEPEPTEIETNPLFVQEAAPSEIVATITLDVRVGEHVGAITLCIPHLTLEPILVKLSAHNWFGGLQRPTLPEEVETMRLRLETAPVDLVAQLGRTELTMRELLQLAPGDVLMVQQPSAEPVLMLVDGRPKFAAEPGLRRGRLAARITGTIDKEDGDA